ncbi:MAG: DHH family phosphoesterase [Clostridia bacterium]|nr:DHH family phosphoesterase [Clostridia bacterium]
MNKKLFNQTFKAQDFILIAILFAFPIATLFFKTELAIVEFIIAIIYTVIRFFYKNNHSEQLYNHLKSITLYLDEASKESLTKFPMPITLLSPKGDIIWYNDLFHQILSSGKMTEVFGKNFDVIAPHITIGDDNSAHKHEITFLGRHYTIFIMRQSNENNDNFYSVYWIDNTETKNELAKLRSKKLCIAYILIDSFDEIPSTFTEMQTSAFITRADVKVREFVNSVDGVMQKLDQDKYLVIFEQKHLTTIEKSKFKILSDVREIEVEGFHATLSIGIGCENESPIETDLGARSALDVALSRGGNQAVILRGDKYSFYGGNSDGAQKRKRVKVRIIAETLMAQVQNSDNVVIMGHKFADLDCVGAAMGIAKCIQSVGKPVYIIYNPKENLSKAMYARSLKLPEFENTFIDVATATRYIDDNTLLIVVDTHNAEYIESEKVYELAKKVVIIDHHRKTVQNAISNTVINFHEPNASSCCEMVSELCESTPNLKLSRHVANALLSGIYLDTKTFSERTGVRTFEAAAYLKRQGADTSEVKEYFKNDIESYKKQIDMISNAEIIRGKYAVSVWREESFEGIKLIASKAADEMLNINDIDCSYVIYPEESSVHISARSDTHSNVQRDMEKLGGGGHRNAAGAQIQDGNIDTVYEMLLEILNDPEREEKN